MIIFNFIVSMNRKIHITVVLFGFFHDFDKVLYFAITTDFHYHDKLDNHNVAHCHGGMLHLLLFYRFNSVFSFLATLSSNLIPKFFHSSIITAWFMSCCISEALPLWYISENTYFCIVFLHHTCSLRTAAYTVIITNTYFL
jgi:hypothetical protein